ncbi:MAG: hypothetical protein RLY70_2693 [Planctomycetota bacterium]|jgi:hypothetical protein
MDRRRSAELTIQRFLAVAGADEGSAPIGMSLGTRAWPKDPNTGHRIKSVSFESTPDLSGSFGSLDEAARWRTTEPASMSLIKLTLHALGKLPEIPQRLCVIGTAVKFTAAMK